MKEWTIGPSAAGGRLDTWLAGRDGIGSRGRAREALECGKVFLNGAELLFSDAGRRLTAGDRVGLWADRPGSARPRNRDIVSAREALDVVYRDEAVLVVNKPPGWLVEPLPGDEGREVTLVDLLADYLRPARRLRPHIVHRIDRDTTGLVLFALTAGARDELKSQFERRTPERVYLAVVMGRPEPAAGVWRDRLVWDKERLVQKRAHAQEVRGKEAVARYRVLEQFRDEALIEVSLVTGKRNQIRVQAGSRGHPLVGERLYRFGAPRDDQEPPFARQALHAARLAFRHPITGQRVEFTAPVPEDIRGLIESLRRRRELAPGRRSPRSPNSGGATMPPVRRKR